MVMIMAVDTVVAPDALISCARTASVRPECYLIVTAGGGGGGLAGRGSGMWGCPTGEQASAGEARGRKEAL